MQTPAQIIEAKGVGLIAGALGVAPATVRMWKSRNRIPRAVWPEIIAAFPDLDLQALLAAEAVSAEVA